MLTFSDELKNLFFDKVENLLNNGETIQHVRTKTTKTEVKNGFGEVIKTSLRTEEQRNTTILPTPHSVLDIVNKSICLERAIKVVTQAGFVVLDPTIKLDNKEKTGIGMSQDVYEQIYSNFLGVSVDKLEGLEVGEGVEE